MTDHKRCGALLRLARHHLRLGFRDWGIQFYLRAEALLPEVSDPVAFLALTLQAERLVQTYLLPEGEET